MAGASLRREACVALRRPCYWRCDASSIVIALLLATVAVSSVAGVDVGSWDRENVLQGNVDLPSNQEADALNDESVFHSVDNGGLEDDDDGEYDHDAEDDPKNRATVVIRPVVMHDGLAANDDDVMSTLPQLEPLFVPSSSSSVQALDDMQAPRFVATTARSGSEYMGPVDQPPPPPPLPALTPLPPIPPQNTTLRYHHRTCSNTDNTTVNAHGCPMVVHNYTHTSTTVTTSILNGPCATCASFGLSGIPAPAGYPALAGVVGPPPATPGVPVAPGSPAAAVANGTAPVAPGTATPVAPGTPAPAVATPVPGAAPAPAPSPAPAASAVAANGSTIVAVPPASGAPGAPASPASPAGPAGANGTAPAAGAAGPTGAATAPTGPVGPTGPTGPVGPTGATGPAGDTGATGAVTPQTQQLLQNLTQVANQIENKNERIAALEKSVYPAWFNTTDVCPDGWFRVGYFVAEGRVHCRLPSDLPSAQRPQNSRCLNPYGGDTVIMVPERYDRSAWCKYCQAPWASYGCCLDANNQFTYNVEFCKSKAAGTTPAAVAATNGTATNGAAPAINGTAPATNGTAPVAPGAAPAATGAGSTPAPATNASCPCNGTGSAAPAPPPPPPQPTPTCTTQCNGTECTSVCVIDGTTVARARSVGDTGSGQVTTTTNASTNLNGNPDVPPAVVTLPNNTAPGGLGAAASTPGLTTAGVSGQPGIVSPPPNSAAAPCTNDPNSPINGCYNGTGPVNAVGGRLTAVEGPNGEQQAKLPNLDITVPIKPGLGYGVVERKLDVANSKLEDVANKFEDEVEDASAGNRTPPLSFASPEVVKPVPEVKLTPLQRARIMRDKINSGDFPLLELQSNTYAPELGEVVPHEDRDHAEPMVALPGPFVPPELPREPAAPSPFFQKLVY